VLLKEEELFMVLVMLAYILLKRQRQEIHGYRVRQFICISLTRKKERQLLDKTFKMFSSCLLSKQPKHTTKSEALLTQIAR